MEETTNKHILLVGDNAELAELTREQLESKGFSVQLERDGEQAIYRILKEDPDLVVVDIASTEKNSAAICRRLRPRFGGTILMLGDSKDLSEEVQALEMGADDYLCKPVNARILLARVRALLRRKRRHFTIHEPDSQVTRLIFGELVVDQAMREARRGDEIFDLTSAEFDLLWLLVKNAGRVLTREEMFAQLRGTEYNGQERSIDVRISRIRPKIGDNSANPKIIKTVRSRGYLFVADSMPIKKT